MFKLRTVPCTFKKTVFEEDRDSFNCQSSINVYHCIQNERNRSGEICIQPVWVQPKYCPEYNTGANTLDTVPCNVSRGCPDVLYHSNEVYKYPVCLNKTYTGSEDDLKENVSSTPGIYIGVVAVSLFIILLAVCLVFYFRKRIQKRGDEESPLIGAYKLEKPFYKSSAFHEGVKFINNGGKILCLVGRWGSGKRSTAKQVYVDVTKSQPIIISDPLTFDAKEHHEPIIVDMTLSIGISKSEKEDLAEKFHMVFKNMSSSNTESSKSFIIFIIDEDRESISNFVRSLLKQKKETKFISLSKSLTKGDRTQILYSHLLTFCPNIGFSQVERLALKGKDKSLGYPEICALFCRCSHFQTVGPTAFCNQPLGYLKSYLENMHRSNDKENFLMLVYMSINKMEINVNDKNDKLFELLESCNCDFFGEKTKCKTEQIENTGTEITGETSNFQQGLSSKDKPKTHYKSKEDIPSIIPKEFVKREESIYRLQHDVIKRMTLVVFGTYHFDKLLRLSKQEDLKPWIKKESVTSNLKSNVAQGDIKPVLEISGEKWRQYQAKLGV